MTDPIRKRRTIKLPNTSKVPNEVLFSISSDEIETSPESKRIIREHEIRLLRRLGHIP